MTMTVVGYETCWAGVSGSFWAMTGFPRLFWRLMLFWLTIYSTKKKTALVKFENKQKKIIDGKYIGGRTC